MKCKKETSLNSASDFQRVIKPRPPCQSSLHRPSSPCFPPFPSIFYDLPPYLVKRRPTPLLPTLHTDTHPLFSPPMLGRQEREESEKVPPVTGRRSEMGKPSLRLSLEFVLYQLAHSNFMTHAIMMFHCWLFLCEELMLRRRVCVCVCTCIHIRELGCLKEE